MAPWTSEALARQVAGPPRPGLDIQPPGHRGVDTDPLRLGEGVLGGQEAVVAGGGRSRGATAAVAAGGGGAVGQVGVEVEPTAGPVGLRGQIRVDAERRARHLDDAHRVGGGGIVAAW